MTITSKFKKLSFYVFWGVVGTGMLVLLVAAIKLRNNKTCEGFRIEIRDEGGRTGVFMDRHDVEKWLDKEIGPEHGWKGRHMMSFDLPRMEIALKKDPWVRDAQLFFDNNGILRITVTERTPVARIFTTAGNTGYLDSSGVELPLSNKQVVELPVFTGYPSRQGSMRGADSLLSVQVRRLSAYILKDSFWMNRIAQVDITPARHFELIPASGDQWIEFGDGSDCEQKFHRLMLFYKDVLIKTSPDKYSRIDVQYAGEVIATRRGAEETHIDSLQGIRNIREMIHEAQQLEADTARQQHIKPLEGNPQTEQTLTGYDLVPAGGDSADSKQKKSKPHL